MKKFLTIVGLLTVIATPALAQANSNSYGTGNTQPFAFDSRGAAHQVVTPDESSQPGARPLYNFVTPQRHGQPNSEIPAYGSDGGVVPQ